MNGIRGLMRMFGNYRDGRMVPGWGKGVLLVIGLIFLCAGALVSQPVWGLDTVQKEALIASLPQGETFENDGSTYVWLPTLQAEKRGGTEAESAAGSATDNMIERKGLFTIYRSSPAPVPSIRTAEGSSAGVSAHPVVLNLKTRSFGIVTGRLWLRLNNMGDAQSMADEYGMPLSFVNAAMSTAFYEVPAGVDILTLRKRLETDPRVVRVTLDMVDRLRHLH